MDRSKLTGIVAVLAIVLVGAIAMLIYSRSGAPPSELPRETVRPPATGQAQAPVASRDGPAIPVQTTNEQRPTPRFGDWQLRCDSIPGSANDQCSLVQTVMAQDRENVGLLVVAFRTQDPASPRILRVIAPLGVLLTSGLGLRVDEANIGATDFVRCVPNGCIAEARLNDDLFERLRTGRVATFIIFQTPDVGIGIPVSLTGFAEGFEALR